MAKDRISHPFAEIFPMIEDAELQELAADIKKNGIQEPIVLFQDKILDGRNRYAACKIAEVTPKMRLFTGTEDDALRFVTSHNLHRRHLTASQRAMIAAKIADMPVGKPVTPETKQEETSGTETTPKPPAKKKTSVTAAAKKMNVSPASVKKAKKVLKKSPAKAKEVEQGKKSLDQAHQEVQKETGNTTDRDVAVKLGNTAIATLGRIKTEFRKDIFERVKIWIDANIEL